MALIYARYSTAINVSALASILLTGVGLACLSGVKIEINKSFESFLNSTEEFNREKGIYLRMMVEQLHAPHVKLISDQKTLFQDVTKILRTTLDNENETDPIVFFGSASLQTPVENVSIASKSLTYKNDDSDILPHEIYHGLIEEATSRKTHIVRYIRLLEKKQFKKRSLPIQRDYVRWLKNQLSQIKRNHNYLLIDTPRAPLWGATSSRLMCGGEIFDFTYKDGVTLFIRDSRIAKSQTQIILRGALDGLPENVRVFNFEKALKKIGHEYTYYNDEDFEGYITDLELVQKDVASG
jgi:hypothetical protein